MLEKITATTNFVIENANYVSIDEEKLQEFANKIKDTKTIHWLASNPFGLLNLSKEELSLFLLIYGSIDFCFWGNPKWTIQTEIGNLDGAFALLYALLKEAKENKQFLTPMYLKNLTEEQFETILKGNTKIPLFKERYYRITSIGKILVEKNITSFYQEINEKTTDTELFDYVIQTFPFLEDTRTYNGKTIYFYKLAQLMTSDILHLRAMKENIKVDISHLVGCADYKLPQVLHQFGVISYKNELEQQLLKKQEINENAKEETEIRAATIVAIHKLSEITGIDAIEINDMIWLQGQDKSLPWIPYHLTKTSSY